MHNFTVIAAVTILPLFTVKTFPKLNFHRFSTFQGAVILQIDLSDGPE